MPQQASVADVASRLRAISRARMTVGLQGTADAHEEGESQPADLARIARALEFGVPENSLPARPFLRTASDTYGRSWVQGFAAAAAAAQRGEDGEVLLRAVGVVSVGDVRDTLRTGDWAPNADVTRERKLAKGRNNATATEDVRPLIDTGQLVQSIRAVLTGVGPRRVIG
jgi:hypothetical protein